MSVRSRTALPLALAIGLVASAQLAGAQSASLVPAATAPASSPAPAPAPSATPAAGPAVDAATVGVRHQVDAEPTPQRRRGGSTPGTALMIVGGAAILVGLVIGGGAGGAIAVAGAVVGLYGLYQYLQ